MDLPSFGNVRFKYETAASIDDIEKNFLKLLDERALEILMELCVDIYAEYVLRKIDNCTIPKKGSPAWWTFSFREKGSPAWTFSFSKKALLRGLFLFQKRLSGMAFFILKKGSPTGVDLDFYNFTTAYVEVYNCTFSFTTAQTGINCTLKYSLYIL